MPGCPFHRQSRDPFERERRLLRFGVNTQSSKDDDDELNELVTMAEQGKLTEDPEKALESHTAKLDRKLNAIPRTLYDSLPVAGMRWLVGKLASPITGTVKLANKIATSIPVIGGLILDIEKDVGKLAKAVGITAPAWSYEAQFEQAVETEARRRLEANGTKLDESRRWLLRRKEFAENHLLLLHAKKLVLEDLQQLQSTRDRELAEREGWSDGLAEYFGRSKTAISREDVNSKTFFGKTFGALKEKVDAEIAKYGKLPDEFEAAKLAQQRISMDLRDAKVKPADIERAFTDLVNGNRYTLELLINAHIRKEQRGDLLFWTKKLSKIPGFQLALGLTSEKDDLVPPMERVQKLFKAPPMKPVLFELNGKRLPAFYETARFGKLIFKVRGKEGKGAYLAINDKGRIGYNNPDGTRARAQIGEANNTLLFNFSDAQLTP